MEIVQYLVVSGQLNKELNKMTVDTKYVIGRCPPLSSLLYPDGLMVVGDSVIGRSIPVKIKISWLWCAERISYSKKLACIITNTCNGKLWYFEGVNWKLGMISSLIYMCWRLLPSNNNKLSSRCLDMLRIFLQCIRALEVK